MESLTTDQRLARRLWLIENFEALVGDMAYYKTHFAHFHSGLEFKELWPVGELVVE